MAEAVDPIPTPPPAAAPPSRPGLTVGLLAFAFFAAFFQISGVDTGFHLRTGEWILENHRIPSVNTFSHTLPEHPWWIHQWWPTILFALVNRAGGVAGLILFKALLATTLAGLCLGVARRAASAPRSQVIFWAVTLLVLAIRPRLFLRPVLFSALLFAALIWLDQRWDANRRWQWLGLPILMAVWANTHAGVVYGWVYLAVVATADGISAGQAWRRHGQRPDWKHLAVRPAGGVISAALAALALEVINPHGIQVILAVFAFTGGFWRQVIVEFQAPTWTNSPGFYIYLATLLVVHVKAGRKNSWREILVLLAFGWLALRAQRSILFFALATLPGMARLMPDRVPGRIGDWIAGYKRPASWLPPLVWLSLVLAWFVPDRTFRFGIGLYPPYYPMSVYHQLRDEVPSQPIFNHMRFGGGILWWLYPKFRPYIDSRGDAYPVSFWQEEYFPVEEARGDWPDRLAKFQVTAALVSQPAGPATTPLARALHDHPDWGLVAFTDNTLLYLKRVPLNTALLKEREFQHIWPGDWALKRLSPANADLYAAEAARALERDAGSIFAQTAAARASLVRGDFSTAVTLLQPLLAGGQGGPRHRRDLAYALFREGRHQEAVSHLVILQNQKEFAGFACFLRHFIALDQGAIPEAQSWLEQAVAWEPHNPEYRQARERFQALTNSPVVPAP